jgi:NAD(P)H-flavin reductase
LVNPYIPVKARVVSVRTETTDVKTFRFKLIEGRLKFEAGQFVEVSVFGVGEAPISISSDPDIDDYFELSVRRVGNVTGSLFKLNEGAIVGIRGPYGRGWPIRESEGMDVLVVGGGCGAAPLRPAILKLLRNRNRYGRLEILYGARTPYDIMYRGEFEKVAEGNDCRVLLTVDTIPPNSEWRYSVGVVTRLFDKISVDPRRSVAFICGPEVMMMYAVRDLIRLGFKPENIYLSMERRMRCGLGFCGHCQIGRKYVCLDGPVFSYSEIAPMPDKIV